MIINYNVPVKQEMCPASLTRQEKYSIKNNKSDFFLDPKQSNCPSYLDVAPRDYPTISKRFKVICEHFQQQIMPLNTQTLNTMHIWLTVITASYN